jgi:hypothetical protein
MIPGLGRLGKNSEVRRQIFKVSKRVERLGENYGTMIPGLRDLEKNSRSFEFMQQFLGL